MLIFRLIKMDLFKNLIDISSENGKIYEFFEFTSDVNKMIGWDKADCEISVFLTPLEEVLLNPEKSYDYQISFFIEQCMKHRNVFSSMFQLRSKKDCVKDLIEGLKAAAEAQKKAHSDKLFEEKKDIENKIENLVNQITSSN